MNRVLLLVLAAGALLPAACNDRKTAEAPAPFELTAAAIGRYCGMNVLEHPGPKGQIILASRIEPAWFSSARDAISFTRLPEEDKDIRAIYVSDMAKAPSWEQPGATNWIDARKATFVVGSRMKGGMGAGEAVPFGEREAAETFARENGGRIVAFAEVPDDYVLGSGSETPALAEEPAGRHGHAPAGAASAGHVH